MEALKTGWTNANLGLYEFLPPLPADGSKPELGREEHVYKTIRCLGTDVPVQGLVVTRRLVYR
eukprot:3960170-Amphidinium_carterae.1